MGGHVDRVVSAVALFFHHRDHHPAHGRDVGDRRARNAAEQGAGDHVGHAQPPALMPEQAAREVDDLVGDAAVQHEFAGEDKEGNGQERKDVHSGNHVLEREFQGETFDPVGGQAA